LKALGRHVLGEFYHCNPEVLNDLAKIENIMKDAALESGATILGSFFHPFQPHGVSGVIVIAESHLSIHTWPEYGYAAVDVFTCGKVVDPWRALRYLKDSLQAENFSAMEVRRGNLEEVATVSEGGTLSQADKACYGF